MVSPENLLGSNYIQKENIVLRYLGIHTDKFLYLTEIRKINNHLCMDKGLMKYKSGKRKRAWRSAASCIVLCGLLRCSLRKTANPIQDGSLVGPCSLLRFSFMDYFSFHQVVKRSN